MATILETYKKDVKFTLGYHKTDSGDLATVDGIENVKQALFRRLITKKGALAHRPNYGIGIKDFLNSPATLANKLKMASLIDEQYKLDPRVEKVLGVGFEINDNTPEKTKISVRVNLLGYGEVLLTFIPFGES